MATVISLTDIEREYLKSQPLARVATVDASGAPQNNPVGAFLDEETGEIIVGGFAMGATRKFRNVKANAHVAVVIDDLVSMDPWTVRGLEIRGTAQALSDVEPPTAVHEPGDHPDHADMGLLVGTRSRGAGSADSARHLKLTAFDSEGAADPLVESAE